MEIIKETVAEDHTKRSSIKGRGGGAAIKRMQDLAQGIYESTPGIGEEIPRA